MSDLALAFVEAFDRRWPSEQELRGLVSRNVRFVARADVVDVEVLAVFDDLHQAVGKIVDVDK